MINKSKEINMLHLLFVDDKEEDLRPVLNLIEDGENLRCKLVDSVDQAKEFIKETPPDIVILDLALLSGTSDLNGKEIENLIWDQYFCPIVIYSGFPEAYEGSDTQKRSQHPFVKIVSKRRDSEDRVIEAIKTFSPYAQALQEIARDVQSAQQNALRDVVPSIVSAIPDEEVNNSIENVKSTVRRRIASMMDEPLSSGIPLAAQTQYLIPPIGSDLSLGDILREKNNDPEAPASFRVVLTPSCDMIASGERSAKVSSVLVAKCDSIKTLIENTSIGKGEMNSKRKKRIETSILTSGFYQNVIPFPGFSGHIPSMGANMKDLSLIPLSDIIGEESNRKFLRVASIDSPFRELISWAYLQVAGRPGLPDRDFASWGNEIAEVWNDEFNSIEP